MKEMNKYKFGLIALGLFTLCLLVFVVLESSGYRQDKQVNTAASEIAEDLNDYISTNRKVPENLSDATSVSIPEAITYTKVNSEVYKFCVTYKADSGASLDASTILFQGLSGDYAVNQDDYEYEGSPFKPSVLYVSINNWQKGENCEEIEPYIPPSYYGNEYESDYRYDDNSTNLDSSLDYLCAEDYEYKEVYEEYCVDGKFVSPY